ncbi:MAG: DUF3881 family protein [Lachnospiraceae bacterium]|nr:DUF3881 family protein [Lachnospiraceae bacterium]
MHQFMQAIGFSHMEDRKQTDAILQDVLKHYDDKMVVEDEEGHLIGEISKSFGTDCGITICGEYDENNDFHMEYYYPYFRGVNISMQEEVILERHAGKESYAGACEDVRVGVTVIFYLQNMGDFLNLKIKKDLPQTKTSVMLSALAKEGTILLPVQKTVEQEQTNRDMSIQRNRMISAARNGDEEAMESLTMEDIDTYSMISRRIATEDVFTIVDTYFMPFGVECDQYNVMGTIESCEQVKNRLTGEELYQMELVCNDIRMDVCINKESLMGEPEVGRRFKGIVWLQGYVNF